MHIRRFQQSDFSEWLRMSVALFPESSVHELASGMREFLTREDGAVFVAERPNLSLAGFVEAGSRQYADGCDSSPVGFIDAWFVDDDVRRTGLGRELLVAAENWARARGYTEMASDALLDNAVSHRAHEASGYQEVERAVRFRKPLYHSNDDVV